MRISIRTRFFMGIIFAIILVLILSTLSYYTSTKERESKAMVSHTIQVRSKLRDININLKDYTSSIRTLRRYESVANLYSDISPLTIAASLEELDLLISDENALQKNITDLKSKLSEIFNFWKGIDYDAARISQRVEKEYYNHEVKILQEINEMIRIIDEEQAELLNARQADTLRLLNFANIANIGGTIIILIIVIILCIFINREFVHRIRAEKRLKENLKKLEEVNSNTSSYNEVLNGAQTLIAACQKATNISSFLEMMIRSIAEFTQSPAGVVYLVEENNEDSFTAAVSLGVKPESIKQTILLSQLPITNVNNDKLLTLVKDIPSDFWNISTAIGSSSPGSIAYIVLNTSARRIGIVELGKFSDFTPQQIEYIHMIAPAISVRLAAVQIEESRNRLLRQLQEQQEILINQQEELRLANDELTQQTQILQASEEELRVQEEELKQINVELEEKNVALESAREVLAMKASELEASGKYKSEFLANMSHELRTPLNSILILATLLKDSKEQNLTSKQVEYAAIIHKSGSDLLKLINDILDLSKIESGKADLNIENIAISSIQENIYQLFYIIAEQNGIHFEVKVSDDTPQQIVSDRLKLEQILKNLISNAFKFTPSKGHVSLIIRPDTKDASTIIFEVKDTGIGIPEDKKYIVFEAFKQADGSTNRKYGGTGLGLSISRELVKILGGNITLVSKENEGSVFSVQLPVVMNTDKSIDPVNNHSPRPFAVVTDNLEEEMGGKGKTILIIEDDNNFSSILQAFAKDREYTTLTAYDGKQGLALAKKFLPDAIILDMQLPVINGWEVLRHLKDDPELKDIPVHVISASDDISGPVKGAIAYLKKPVSKEALENAFALIGLKVHSKGKKVLILKGMTLKGSLLESFIENIPPSIDMDIAENFGEAVLLGNEYAYGCVIADIGEDIEAGIKNIEKLRSIEQYHQTSVIIFIDKEISQSEELKLKKISEAVVMNSKEVHKRLADEMELFLHKLENTVNPSQTVEITPFPFETDFLRGKKVLLADDDMRNVFALVSLLEEHGMEVSTAGNGREAVEILENDRNHHIVLMDIMMPEMDGYEAMKIIRNNRQLHQLPIIAITAKAMAEDRELCIAAGASDYISKPVDNQKLLSLMRVWLSR